MLYILNFMYVNFYLKFEIFAGRSNLGLNIFGTDYRAGRAWLRSW